jgi:hypothetical protein
MKILDDINAKMGKMTIFYGSQGMAKQRRREKKIINQNYIIQDNLFTYNKNEKISVSQSDTHMKILDDINTKMGKMTIFYGSQGIVKQRRREKIEEDKWRMRSGYKSPFYTTNWNDILKVP